MNFYELLHITEDAPEEVIKLAYKGLVQKYHPDRYKGSDANEKVINLKNAYEVLIDPIKRKEYDEKLKEIRTKSNLKKESDISSKEINAKNTLMRKKKILLYVCCILVIFVIVMSFLVKPKTEASTFIDDTNKISTIAGLSLGNSPVEVTLLKGQAHNSSDRIDDNTYFLNWNYHLDDSPNLDIHFIGSNKDDLKIARICGVPFVASIAEFGMLSNEFVPVTEKELESYFGKPDHISIHKDGLLKWISYKKYNAAFEVEKGKIIYVCLDEDYLEYQEEFRGL